MDGEANKIPTICLLGSTGTGKSSTGNSIFKRRDVFKISDRMESMTCMPTIKELPWRGVGELVRCVDLPGLADTEGRDAEHIEAMVNTLKSEVRYVHAFLMIINGTTVRLDGLMQDMLKKFKDVFGEEFLRNFMVGFTYWNFKAKALKRRNRVTEADKSKDYNAKMRSVLGHEFDVPCIFLDNELTNMPEEDLEDEYEEELPVIQAKVEAELQKVYNFVRSREPFFCQNIEAVLADREKWKQWVGQELSRASSLLDPGRLKRKLISADNDFVRGRLRVRQPPPLPPRTVWAVVRRQQLQLYSDESEVELESDIKLLHCICGKSGWHLVSRWCFLIYKPIQDASNSKMANELRVRIAEKYEFGVDTERDRRRWMYLVQEATRISESWSRICRFAESLQMATRRDEYVRAINGVASETMVIPMEWVRDNASGTEAVQQEVRFDQKQADRDLGNVKVTLDGRTLNHPTADDLATDVVLRLRKWAAGRRDDDPDVDAKALLLSRDVVFYCTQTTTTGDILSAVYKLFNKEDVVHIIHDGTFVEPTCVRILRPDGTERVLQQDFLRLMDSSSGLPQFQNDASAEYLSFEKVRNMNLEDEQRLQVDNVGRNSWVPDWEMLQCMKCGVQFGTWVRRHHCRHCGALICSSCSQHSVELLDGSASRSGSQPQMGRVCFTCFQKAVVEDLNNRRSTGVTASESAASGLSEADTDAPLEPQDPESDPCGGPERGEVSGGSFCSLIPEEGNDWPVINIEMTAQYKVYCAIEMKELFRLHCRHVRQVRWSGVSDAGRLVISIEAIEEIPKG